MTRSYLTLTACWKNMLARHCYFIAC